MTRQRQLILRAGGVAVLGCVVGLAVFLVFGSEEAILFTAVGVPGLLVGFGGVYVWSVYDRSGTNQSEYIQHRARSTADTVREAWTEYDQLRDQYSGWSPGAVETELEQVIADLEDQGITFDTESATYSLGRARSRDIQELDRLQSAAEELDERVLESFRTFVDERIETMDRELSRLVDDGLVDQIEWPDGREDSVEGSTADADTETPAETLDRHRTEAITVVDRATESLEVIVQRHQTGDSVPTDSLERARQAARDWEFDTAVDHISAVKETVEGELSTAFEDESKDLERLLEALQARASDTPVDQETLDRIDRLEAEINEHESSLELQSLREQRDELRSVCAEIIRALDTELDGHLDTLDRPDVPDEYVTRPHVADREYLRSLDEEPTLEKYREHWVQAVSELLSATEEVRTKASIVETYPKLESRIRDTLERTGRVTEEDLPMRSPTELMQLYSLSNPEVSFDLSEPVLTMDADRESYIVTVTVTSDPTEESHEVVIELEEGSRTRTKSVRVDGSTQVRFDGVSYGECTVRANPTDPAYGQAEVTAVVDGETPLELTVSEVSAVERLCKGRADKIEEYLDDFGSELESRFQADGYVSSQMSFPLSDDYIPCLLALWADREGLAVAVDDADEKDGGLMDHVYVYDDETVQSRIKNTVKYNIDPGEEVSFDALRNKFLSAPIPDASIREMAERTAVEEMEVTGRTLMRTEGEN